MRDDAAVLAAIEATGAVPNNLHPKVRASVARVAVEAARIIIEEQAVRAVVRIEGIQEDPGPLVGTVHSLLAVERVHDCVEDTA